MSTRPGYDAAAVERSVDVLRATVEEAGGIFADLHRVLPQSDFKDFGGIKKATKVVSKRDGEDFIKSETTDFKVLDKVDPKAFTEPS